MNIRLATAADAGQIAKLIEVLALKFITLDLSPVATQHLLNANNEAAISSFMQQGFVYFVAEHADATSAEIIGCIGMRHNSHLYHLFVTEDWQGQGLARLLWQQAMQYCEAEGNPGSYTVNSSNNAVAVYQALGFVRTGPVQQMHGVWFNPMQLDMKHLDMKQLST
jgi:GNAT superfamily N-acetyltransferase